jgi:hypothetical protein
MEGAVATDQEPHVTLVHRDSARLIFRVRVGNAELIVEASGVIGSLVRALEQGTPGALYGYLDYDVEKTERDVKLSQRSFCEGPNREQLRRCVVRVQPAEWRRILAQMCALARAGAAGA